LKLDRQDQESLPADQSDQVCGWSDLPFSCSFLFTGYRVS